MRILYLLRRRLKNASTFANSSLKANPIFLSEEKRKGFAKQNLIFSLPPSLRKIEPSWSRHKCRNQKDSKEPFYLFKSK